MPINEDEFLEAFLPTLNQDDSVIVPPGDDCAAIAIGEDLLLLLAVDQVVENIHYSAVVTDANLAGRKLLARNLSDIAAMGGTPKYALTAIGMPNTTSPQRLQDFAEGIKNVADIFNISLIGGDLTQGSSEFASLTIIGTVPAQQVCRRSSALAGDRIFVTGAFGGSFQSGRHLTFDPRIPEGRWLAENGMTRCMIDASDGLVKDLGRIARASELTAMVDENAIPIHDGCELQQALYDGEDYELIISVRESDCQKLVATWPFETSLTEIGAFSKEGLSAVCSQTREGVMLDGGAMFSHFARK